MAASKPGLAIVIPAYNEEKYIGGCLESIARQTVAPDEVIVVDNNSTDKTAVIAASFPFVRLLRESAQGIAPARNRGFNEATSELIARLDADTQLPPDWIAIAHKLMDQHAKTITALSGPPSHIHDLPPGLGRKLIGRLVVKHGYFKVSKLMLGHHALFGANMLITKKAWQRVKKEVCLNSRAVHEDMDLALHVAKYGEVLYSTQLTASVARRTFFEPPSNSLWRLRIWPKTVTKHRKLFAKYHPPTKK